MTTTAELVLQALSPYRLKKEKTDADGVHYRCNSPFRTNSDSKAFSLLVRDGGEKGGYIDRTGGTQGSLYDLAALLGITPVGERQDVKSTKREYASLEDYAAAHHVAAKVFTDAGWTEGRFQTHENAKPRFGLAYKVGDVERYRWLEGNPKEKFGWDTKNGAKGKSAWYGLRRAMRIAKRLGYPLVLCNGAPSVVVAQHYDVPAACWEGGERALPQEAIDALLLAWDGDILFAYDCDETGRKAAAESAALLSARTTAIIDLGLTENGDLADYCGYFTAETMNRLLRKATAIWSLVEPPPPEEPPAVSLAKLDQTARSVAQAAQAVLQGRKIDEDVIRQEITRMETIVGSLRTALNPLSLLSSADLAGRQDEYWKGRTASYAATDIHELHDLMGYFAPLMYGVLGATGMGKSWFAVSMVRSLIGLGRGLIISTEMNPDSYHERITASLLQLPPAKLRAATGQTRELIGQVRDFQKRDCYVIMDLAEPTPGDVRTALDTMKRNGMPAKWLIVDSGSNMVAGGQTLRDQQAGVSHSLQVIAREYGIPVFVTIQTGRDLADRAYKEPQPNDAYGTAKWEHDCDQLYGLFRMDYYVAKYNALPDTLTYPPGTARLRLLKNRDGEEPMPNCCTVRYVGGCGFYTMKDIAF